MCNYFEYEQLDFEDYFDNFSHIKLPLRFPEGQPPNLLPSRATVYPTNLVQAFRAVDPAHPGEGVETFQPRWGLIPGFWRKPVKEWKASCFNARSEDAAEKPTFRSAFKRRRCLIPATGFYDFTGPKGDKTRWLFKRDGQKWFCFAGLWDRAETADGMIETCTLMTTVPGADVEPYHHRQPVILEREDWARWLDLEADPAPLMATPPGGRLTVTKASPLRREGVEAYGARKKGCVSPFSAVRRSSRSFSESRLPYAALIDWVGPFGSIRELKATVAEFGVGEALYLAIGSRPRQRQSHIQYVGITTDLGNRFNGKHPIQTLLKPTNLRLFVGIVTSQAVAGRKASHHAVRFSPPLYLAESALAFLMEVPLNKDKRCNPPKDSVVVVNRWYGTDFESRRRRRPHSDWPDLVEFDRDEGIGDLAWHGRRRTHLNADAVADIGRRARKELAAAREAKAAPELALIRA